MRDYALAHPDVVRALAAVFDDLGQALVAQPASVKAIVARLYPDLDGPTLDLLFAAEAPAWRTLPPTEADMVREIGFVTLSGVALPQIDGIVPSALLAPGADRR